MQPKILIVDDEPLILDILEFNLQNAGYQTLTATNGHTALDILSDFTPDLILLDIMMPEMDGLTLGKKIKNLANFGKTKIVYLTAQNDEDSEIEAFELGATDFVNKPIKPKALISRLNNLLKKDQTIEQEQEWIIKINNLEIDKNNYTVKNTNGEIVKLPKKEFGLLHMLASEPDKVHTRNAILDKIWGADIYVVDRTIDVHIRKIREKIDVDCIQTIKGVGYLLAKKI